MAMAEQQSKSKNKAEKSASKPSALIAKFRAMDTKKKIQVVAIALVIVIMLAIYFGSSAQPGGPAENTQQQPAVSPMSSAGSVEERLKQTLERIAGAGRVEVMITYAQSAEIIPAVSEDTQRTTTTDTSADGNSTTNTENTQQEIVTVGGSDQSALVIKEKSPVVKGVLVIAQGAGDIGVKLDLLSAVQTILNIGPDQVDVYKMNNE